MKTLFLTLLVSSPAFAASTQVSLSDFREVAEQEQAAFAGQECTVTVRELNGGLAISAQDSANRTELLVKNSDAVTVASDALPGSSFSRTYEVAGVGTFRVLYADDSYTSLEITSGGRTVKCETDF